MTNESWRNTIKAPIKISESTSSLHDGSIRWLLTTICIAATLFAAMSSEGQTIPAASKTKGAMRVASIQAKRRIIDYRLKPSETLAAVDKNLIELERLVHKAGETGCAAVALPEDTLGLLNWIGMNEKRAK